VFPWLAGSAHGMKALKKRALWSNVAAYVHAAVANKVGTVATYKNFLTLANRRLAYTGIL